MRSHQSQHLNIARGLQSQFPNLLSKLIERLRAVLISTVKQAGEGPEVGENHCFLSVCPYTAITAVFLTNRNLRLEPVTLLSSKED